MMYYIEKFKEIIENSKYTKLELADKLNISNSAISKVLNNQQRPFDEETNIKICKLCGVDERILNIANGLDLLGDDFYKLLYLLKKEALAVYKYSYPNEDSNKISQLFYLDLVEFVIKLIDSDDSLSFEKGNMYLETMPMPQLVLKEEENIILEDDKMEPYILKGSKLYFDFKKEYKRYDVVYIKLNNNKEIVGKINLISNEKINILFWNQKYNNITISKNDIKNIYRIKAFKYEFN